MFSICSPDLEAHVFAWHEFGFMFGSAVKSQLALSVDWSLNDEFDLRRKTLKCESRRPVKLHI